MKNSNSNMVALVLIFAASAESLARDGSLIHSVELQGMSHIAPLNIPLNQVVDVDLHTYGINLYIEKITISGVLNTFGGSWANDVGFQFRSPGSISGSLEIYPALGIFQNGNGIGVGPSTVLLSTPFTVSNSGQISILLFDTSYDIAGQPDATWQSGTIEITLAQCLPADTAEPYGILDFFDVSAFLQAFTSSEPIADITGDGDFNFFDVSAFLNAFSSGCP